VSGEWSPCILFLHLFSGTEANCNHIDLVGLGRHVVSNVSDCTFSELEQIKRQNFARKG